MKRWKIIQSYHTFAAPFPGYEPQNQAQTQLLDHLGDVYLGVEMWLRYFELGQHECRPAIVHCPQYRPLYDLSRATWTFCGAAFLAVDWAQEIAKHPDELWAFCEGGRAQEILLNAGYYGSFVNRSTSKRALHQAQLKVLNPLSEIAGLESELSVDEFTEIRSLQAISEYSYLEYSQFTNRLLASALKIAEDQDDDNLMRHCQRFIHSKKSFIQASKNSPIYQIASIDRGEIEFTGKSKKSRRTK